MSYKLFGMMPIKGEYGNCCDAKESEKFLLKKQQFKYKTFNKCYSFTSITQTKLFSR